MAEIIRLGGTACLKQLEKALHIPQSTCAGRINDLIVDGKVTYHGLIEFEGRLRKKIVIVQPKVIAIKESIDPTQQSLEFGT